MILNATEIIEYSKLEDIIMKFVELKRQGSNYVGKSPWVDEKTGSFVVSPSKRIYKCFSSGKGGNNPAQFLMDYKGYTFPEAVEYLAQESHILIQYSEGFDRTTEIQKYKEERSAKEKMVAALQKAHDFYRSISKFAENESGLISIAGKSYTPQSVAKWELVTVSDFNTLEKPSKNWKERADLIEGWILRQNKAGTGYYDFFHHRLCFPLFDESGKIVGYNGRILEQKEGDKSLKYLNTADTLLFNKSKYLFGYFQNWKEIRRLNIATLVEGPTDVILMDQHNISNGVCSSGTSFTIDQAKLIARCADMIIITFDGDDPGIKAIKKAINISLLAQLDVKVRILPDGHDPASYLESHGKVSYEAIPAEDAIEWYILNEYPDPKNCSPTDKAGALLRAANLIYLIKSDHIRDQYCTTISKILGITTKTLKDTIQELLDMDEEKRNRLTPEQEQMKMAYGVYIDNNQYYHNNGRALSNFIIKPLFLVRGKDLSRRVFEISNLYGEREVIQMVTDDFIQMTGFKKKVESLGNFLLLSDCKEEHYIKIKSIIYKEMESVIPIDVLGYHKGGYYSWSNGLTDREGKFNPIDDYGIVEVKVKDKKVKFYLPTFSNIDKVDENLDDENNNFDHYFVYREDPEMSMTLPKMIDMWKKIFGTNAIIALSYYFSSIYRDFIFTRHSNTFPILNIFGPPGSGKTFMSRALTSFFGSPQDMKPFNCINSSVSAYSRRIAQGRNSLAHFDEYGFEVTPEKAQVLKDFFDGGGRTLSDKNNREKLNKSVVRAACVLTGQILPSHDVAFMERVVSIYTAVIKVSGEQKKYAQAFEDRGDKGIHTQITAELFSYRDEVLKRYDNKFEEVTDHVRRLFGNDQPKYRFIANYSMIATTFFIIADILKEKYNYNIPWKTSDIYDLLIERLKEQVITVEEMDEISAFFKMVEYLIYNNILKTDMYACEEDISSLRIETDNKEIKDKNFEPTTVLFLNMSFTHQLYKIHSKQAGDIRILQESTLKNYLKTNPAFLGTLRGKKIGGKTVRAWAFDTTKLDRFNFLVTTYSQKNHESTTESTTENQKSDAGMTFSAENVPF